MNTRKQRNKKAKVEQIIDFVRTKAKDYHFTCKYMNVDWLRKKKRHQNQSCFNRWDPI